MALGARSRHGARGSDAAEVPKAASLGEARPHEPGSGALAGHGAESTVSCITKHRDRMDYKQYQRVGDNFAAGVPVPFTGDALVPT